MTCTVHLNGVLWEIRGGHGELLADGDNPADLLVGVAGLRKQGHPVHFA